ncbi:MAG TPA: ATP synthase F0 subunit B [Bryobacteraceae bacterium]|jgi:F0F1-type ATP synthase membrane subunit b/b'|nr:ATP synthase F0 subunit B [Bryobacteraceae bacterium]
MRKFPKIWAIPVFLCVSAFCIAGTARAQETGAAEQNKQEQAEPEGQMTWKIVNTAIFAVLLGWGIAKTAPGFFNARSADIQKAIKDATGLKIEADFRYSAIDRKMATLGDEVNRLRAEWETALEHEHQRILAETQAERERIQHHVDAEIEGFRAESALRLRQHTARAALKLTEQRLQELGPSQDDPLLGDLIRLVEGSAA